MNNVCSDMFLAAKQFSLSETLRHSGVLTLAESQRRPHHMFKKSTHSTTAGLLPLCP